MKLFIAAVLLAVSVAVVAEAATESTYDVSPNEFFTAWVVNGVENPALTLYRGRTYTFNISATGHPFDIKTSPTIGVGNRFNTGVTGQGTQNGTLTFAVPASAPATLFYQCEVHSPMSGTLHIADRTVPGVMPAGLGLLAIAIGALGANVLRRRIA